MAFSLRQNPLPVLAGFLTFQVSGWLMGKRVFDSLNSEAMLFTFLAGGVGLLAWLFFKMDSYSPNESMIGRTVWISSVVIGVILGLYVRTQM